MKYQGGKGRIARRLVERMLEEAPDTTKWVEPFLGGAWMLEAAHRSGHFTSLHAGDAMPDIMMLYQEVARGWEPPRVTTREQHADLKHAEPSAMRALVGFGSCYGGTFFSGFCGDAINGSRTNAEIAAEHLVRRRDVFRDTDLRHQDYREWDPIIDSHTLVYCDPPYANTAGYRGTEPFNHGEFWKWCRAMADRGAAVFVSEYTVPNDADDGWLTEVWHRTAKQTAARHANHIATERLFLVEPSITVVT